MAAAPLVIAGVQAAMAAKQYADAQAVASAQAKAASMRNQQLVEQTVANYDQLSEVELDAQQRSLEDTVSVQKDYLQQKGRINVMAAAMGTGGMSVSSQLSDLERNKYSNYKTILLNKQSDLDNIRSQAENLRYQAASSMDVRPISRPSRAALALNIGATAVGGYSDYQKGLKLQSMNQPVGAGG